MAAVLGQVAPLRTLLHWFQGCMLTSDGTQVLGSSGLGSKSCQGPQRLGLSPRIRQRYQTVRISADGHLSEALAVAMRTNQP